MIFRVSLPGEIGALTRISKTAFDTDISVGNTEPGGPPEYDCAAWHQRMMESEKLYCAICDDRIIGGAVLFPDAEQKEVYIGRIFVDPAHFRKGYGIAIMEQIEKKFAGYLCKLDTPVWNMRTNRFYQKLGYRETGRDEETVFYEKELPYEAQ